MILMAYHPLYNSPLPLSISCILSHIADYDTATALHSIRVKTIAVQFSLGLNLSPDMIRDVAIAALLHDAGKVKIPREILNKPGKLAAHEWEIMKQHPQFGLRILNSVSEFDNILTAILYHHEKFNGTGYPEGLRGEDIPLVSRILSIADVYEALTSDRPYRKAMDKKTALNIIKEGKCAHFDPVLADAFALLFSGAKTTE